MIAINCGSAYLRFRNDGRASVKTGTNNPHSENGILFTKTASDADRIHTIYTGTPQSSNQALY